MNLQSLGRPTCNPTMFLYHRDGGHHPDRWNVPTITVTYTLVKENTVTGNDLRCRTLLLCCARFRPFLSENHRYRAFRCKSTYLKKMFAIGDSEFPPWKLSKLCHPVCLLYVQRSMRRVCLGENCEEKLRFCLEPRGGEHGFFGHFVPKRLKPWTSREQIHKKLFPFLFDHVGVGSL